MNDLSKMSGGDLLMNAYLTCNQRADAVKDKSRKQFFYGEKLAMLDKELLRRLTVYDFQQTKKTMKEAAISLEGSNEGEQCKT